MSKFKRLADNKNNREAEKEAAKEIVKETIGRNEKVLKIEPVKYSKEELEKTVTIRIKKKYQLKAKKKAAALNMTMQSYIEQLIDSV